MIKQNRKLRNMTLEELAKGICSISYLSKIENNAINASDEIYRLLGERLGIKLTDIDHDFDESIHQDLMDWHETIHLRDFPLADELKKKCQKALEKNKNIELENLYKVILTRHIMSSGRTSMPESNLNELNSIVTGGSKEFQFFYNKTVGLHYLVSSKLVNALHCFLKAEQLMEKLPYKDPEVYFHLALTYAQTRSFVESNFYAQKALEVYKSSLHYSKMIDNHLIIAINYNSLEAYTIAEDCLLDILKMAKYHLPVTEKRRVYHNLGKNYIHQERYEEAAIYLQKAYEIDTEETAFSSSTIYLLALTHYYNNDMEECWSYIEKGEKEALRHNFLKYKHKFYILKTMIDKNTHDEEFIIKLEKEIIPDFLKLNEYKDYKYFVEMLGNIYYEKRMYKKAATQFKEANNYKITQKKDLL
ncbi:helix-turn-helix domain-containing protein [Halobacillus sp. BBL2006]|uniref:helix-turn-helix domain-containing protein n=1 Tax=Halobacillus sp. BBL2006 TaxID=1543706 RepID=UPI001E3EEBBE|nr:tetratricopeptide repeat protein [Halobacillus sp. BBL2006]